MRRGDLGDVSLDRLERACTALGETVLDPARWPQVMQEISQAVSSTGAALLQSDVRTPDVPRTASVDELFVNYFRDEGHLRDTRASRGVPLLLQGEKVLTDQDLLTAEELRKDTFYNEALRPFGFSWFAVVGFFAGPALWGLSIQRTAKEGPFASRDKGLLIGLSRRLTEVATLSTAVGRATLSSATNVLNEVGKPAIAVDRFGRVIDVNEAAQSAFDADFQVVLNRLRTSDSVARLALERLYQRLRITPDGSELDCEPIIVRRRGKAPLLIEILPVHGAARTPFLGARVLLTFSATAKPASAELLGKIFGFTPAEIRLASILAQGVDPTTAAERLGISRNTARNQLRAIFAKSGTHRQSELVLWLNNL